MRWLRGVADVQAALPVEAEAGGAVELRPGARTAVAGEAAAAVAGDRGDDPGGVDVPDHVRFGVADVEAAVPCRQHPEGGGQDRFQGGAAVPLVSVLVGPGDHGHPVVDAEADDVGDVVGGDVDVAARVDLEIPGVVQRRVDGQGAVLGGPLEILADDGLDGAVTVYPPDPQVVPVEDERAGRCGRTRRRGGCRGRSPAPAGRRRRTGAARCRRRCRSSPARRTPPGVPPEVGESPPQPATGKQGCEGKGNGEEGVEPAGKTAAGKRCRPRAGKKRPR